MKQRREKKRKEKNPVIEKKEVGGGGLPEQRGEERGDDRPTSIVLGKGRRRISAPTPILHKGECL